MEYIQKLFLDVESCVEANNELDVIIDLLDKEPPEFRSVAYESASMVIGARDLCNSRTLNNWKEFRETCSAQHGFHVDIGLGWAFAKTGLQPNDFLGSVNPAIKRMVFDGMGYYYGLFKGRSTLKNGIIPGEIEDIIGFDQGLGRRLWYFAKGNVDALVRLIQGFHETRHPDLWRGVGIACGYVGGNKEEELKRLSNAAETHKEST